MVIKISAILIIFFSSLVVAQTTEEQTNMETLDKWGEVWLNGNFELVKDIVNPIYIRHEPTGTIRVKQEACGNLVVPHRGPGFMA